MAPSATGTVRAVRWVPVARDVRIRRSAAPGRRIAPRRAFRLVREPTRLRCSRNRSWGMSPSKLATGLAILRGATPSRGMTGRNLDRTQPQRIRRMWTDCTSPNIAK